MNINQPWTFDQALNRVPDNNDSHGWRLNSAHGSGHDKSARLPRRAQVTRSARLTETGTILVAFKVIDDEQFDFLPGQFVAIDIDHPVLGHRRSPYCLHGASSQNRTFSLLVRVVAEGPVSLFLDELAVGDIVSFRGPSGHSMVPKEPDTHLILLATGVGLGACRCLLEEIVRIDPLRKITLYWGLRLEADICLADELDSLEVALANFTWHVTLSQPTLQWSGMRGRLTESVTPLLSSLSDKHFYLLCNGSMVAEMSAALREAGVPDHRIHEESFFDHRHKPTSERIAEIASLIPATDLVSHLIHLDYEIEQGR